MTDKKAEPIFTINREDGSTREVFETDLDEKTMPLANELSSVNRSIQYKRNSELYQQAIHLTQDLRSLERDSNNSSPPRMLSSIRSLASSSMAEFNAE